MGKIYRKRSLACLIGMTAAVFVMTGCTAKETANVQEQDEIKESAEVSQKGEELNLFTWDGMFPREVIDQFEKETGIKVNYSNFDYDEDMLAKLEESKGGDYDLVIADDYIIEIAIKENLVQKLDREKLPNFSNINPLYQGQFYDEADEYTVPYGAGIPLIVYNPQETGFEITSYEDLWNPQLLDNLALIGNYRVINGIALKTMGESFNTQDLDKIRAAGDKLMELAPNIRVINDNNTQDFLVSGEVSAAFLYTSQVTLALEANPELEVVYPKEGLGFGIMAGFVPVNAPNADAAHAFLNYILEPQTAAKCFESIGYYCTNKAAEEYISEEMKDRIVVPESVKEGEIVQNIAKEAEDLHAQIWNEFKNQCN